MGGLHPGRLLAVRSALASPRQLPGRRRLPHPSRRSPEAATGGCIAAGGRRLAARSALAQAPRAPAPPRAACRTAEARGRPHPAQQKAALTPPRPARRTAEGMRPAASRPAGGRPHPSPPGAAHGGGPEPGGRPQPAQHGGRRPWAVAARILVRVSDYSLVFGYPRVSVLGIDFDPN